MTLGVARRLVPALLGVSFLVVSGAPAQEAEPGREAELEALRQAIERLEERMERIRSERTGLMGELAHSEITLRLQAKRVSEARLARRTAEEAVATVAREVEELEDRLAGLRTQLRGSLTDLYRLGRRGYARLFLSIPAPKHLLPGVRHLRYRARRDADTLNRYREVRAELDGERETLEVQRAQLAEWQRREAERLAQVERFQRRQALLLADLEAKRQELEVEAARLSDKEVRLSNLIDFLYGRSGKPLAGTPAQEFRGALDWPVAGTVVEEFGPRLDPRYKTRVPHNGVAIETDAAAVVRAVFPGRVLFAAHFEGYGPTAIVDHAGGVFTLYAGLDSLDIREDAMVGLGGVIGRSSGRIYFEIRADNRPENPRDWLR